MADEEKKDQPVEEAEAPKEEETSKEEPAPAGDKSDAGDSSEDMEVPEKFKKLVDEVENMSVIELHELVKTLEKKFGVSAAAVAVAQGPAGGGTTEEGEGQSSFTVELKSAGEQKIQVIKAVKELLGLGLKEAKDMVDGAPSVLKEGVKKEEAEEIKAKIEGAGGSVELK